MIEPAHTLTPDWQNENALRAYPLADDAPAARTLPAWFLSDLRVTVGADYDAVFVSSAYFSGTLLSVGISGVRGTHRPEGLLVRTVTRDELEADRAYALDRLGTAAGSVSFGAPPPDARPFKRAFAPDEAPLAESAVVRLKAPGVTAVVDPVHGVSADGLIDLSGNSEFRTYADPSDPTGRTIVIELADLYRDSTTSICSSVPSFDRCGVEPVKTINGVAPDAQGRITLKFT